MILYDETAIAYSLRSPDRVPFPRFWNGMTVMILSKGQTGLEKSIGGYTFQVEPSTAYHAVPVYSDGLHVRDVVKAVVSQGWTPRGLLKEGQGTPMLLVSRSA